MLAFAQTTTQATTQTMRIDEMIRRRANDRQAQLIVVCALKNLAIPAGALPPAAPAVEGNQLMGPWLPTMDIRSDVVLSRVEHSFDVARDICLGASEPLDRLRAVDAVRRSLIVAVGRGDADVAVRAMRLLNDLGACDERGRSLTIRDCSSLEALDAALDAKVRPLEYWLAIHHFERRWLCERRHSSLWRNRVGCAA